MDATVKQKLEQFFERQITEKELAKHIRRFKYIMIKLVLESDEDFVNKEWVSDGHFWLTELCEILEPQLTEE